MKKKLFVLLISLVLLAMISGCLTTDTPNQPNQTEEQLKESEQEVVFTDQQIDSLIEKMSLEAKLGQMIIAGLSGTRVTEEEQSLIRDYQVGGIIFYAKNLTSPPQTLALLNQLKMENKNNLLPLFLAVDQEGGRVSRLPKGVKKLPDNKQLGDIADPWLAFAFGASLGEQLRAFGFNLNFAPVLDVHSNPNNPIIGTRSFGSDPQLVSRLGRELMKGIQSKQIISVIKHFPGHGDTSVDSHLELPVVTKTRAEFEQMELIPFRDAIQNGADVVMIAHILVPQLDTHAPATLSKTIITDLLRSELGFKGIVITDDLTMKAITNHYDLGAASVAAIKAGSDLLLIAHEYDNVVNTLQALQEAVEKGELTEERINESVHRIIHLKWTYSLSNEPVEQLNLEALDQSISNLLKQIEKHEKD